MQKNRLQRMPTSVHKPLQRILKDAIPDYTLTVLSGRDHMSAMSDPEFNEKILEFLNANPATP